MNYAILLMLFSSCTGEFIVSDFYNKDNWLVDNNFKLKSNITFPKPELELLPSKATIIDKKIFIYSLKDAKIYVFQMMEDGKLSEKQIVDIHVPIDSFDVQPSGRYFAVSSDKKILLVDGNKVVEIHEAKKDINRVFIHPSKKLVYYHICWVHLTNYFITYDFENKKISEYVTPICSSHMSIDHKENKVWLKDSRKAYSLDLNTNSVELIWIIEDTRDLELDAKYLFYTQDWQDLHKLTLNPLLQKLEQLPDYSIEPALSKLDDKTPILFDIDNNKIEILDEHFKKTTNQLNFDFIKKPIKRIRAIRIDSNETIFIWIHEPNNGDMYFVNVSSVNNWIDADVKAVFSSEIIDFDFYKEEEALYVAYKDRIFKLQLDDEWSDSPLDFFPQQQIRAVGINYQQRNFYSYRCDGNVTYLDRYNLNLKYELDHVEFPYEYACPNVVVEDQEENGLLMSADVGIFYKDQSWKYVQIYGKAIRNFLYDKDNVYFVSKTPTGPAIYKVDKHRSSPVLHNLEIRDGGHLKIIKPREHEENEMKDEGDDKRPNSGTIWRPSLILSLTSSSLLFPFGK